MGRPGRRHPALRTVFVEAQGEPRALVTADLPPLEVIDLRGDDPAGTRFDSLVDERLAVPFDPSAGPLTRTTLFLRADARWSLLLLADHLVCDGRSLEVLATQLVAAYADPAAVGPPEDRPAHRPTDQEAALDHWRGVLLPLRRRCPSRCAVRGRSGQAAPPASPCGRSARTCCDS